MLVVFYDNQGLWLIFKVAKKKRKKQELIFYFFFLKQEVGVTEHLLIYGQDRSEGDYYQPLGHR